MKILVITSNFPPYHCGGYELRIKDIADGLAGRGHTIRVITNKPDRKVENRKQAADNAVIRKLHTRLNARVLPVELFFDLSAVRLVEKQILDFKPDLIYLGQMFFLSNAILPYLSGSKLPVVFDDGDTGIIYAWSQKLRRYRYSNSKNTPSSIQKFT